MNTGKKAATLGCLLILTCCGVKKATNSSTNNPSNTPCRAPVEIANSVGTCKIRQVAPKSCEVIDLTAGKSYKFVWTSDATFCQAPYTAYIAGNPFQTTPGNNILSWEFPLRNEITNYGGSASLTAQDIASLSSNDGTFEWTIEDPQHSHPAGVVFRVKR